MTGAPDYTLNENVLGPRFDAPPWSLCTSSIKRDGCSGEVPCVR